MSGQFSAGGFASIALASLSASRWCLCMHCAVIVAGLVLALLPMLRWPLPPHCAGIAPSIKNWCLPNHNTITTHLCVWHCCRGHRSCQWPHCHTWHRYMVTWPSMVWPMQRWLLCQRCAGILARIVLASLPTLRCLHCWRCAGIIALVVRALLPSLHWHCCPRCLCVAASIANWHLPSHKAVATCIGIITSIEPLLLPELRQHHCPCRAAVFAFVTLALLTLSQPCHRQHHKVASAQS
jgi:hypothetical protein